MGFFYFTGFVFFKKKIKKIVVSWCSSPQSCCLEETLLKLHDFVAQSKQDVLKCFYVDTI